MAKSKRCKRKAKHKNKYQRNWNLEAPYPDRADITVRRAIEKRLERRLRIQERRDA